MGSIQGFSKITRDNQTALDHDAHVEQIRNVAERITRNDHDISELARLQRADLRVECHEFRGIDGEYFYNVARREQDLQRFEFVCK